MCAPALSLVHCWLRRAAWPPLPLCLPACAHVPSLLACIVGGLFVCARFYTHTRSAQVAHAALRPAKVDAASVDVESKKIKAEEKYEEVVGK